MPPKKAVKSQHFKNGKGGPAPISPKVLRAAHVKRALKISAGGDLNLYGRGLVSSAIGSKDRSGQGITYSPGLSSSFSVARF